MKLSKSSSTESIYSADGVKSGVRKVLKIPKKFLPLKRPLSPNFRSISGVSFDLDPHRPEPALKPETGEDKSICQKPQTTVADPNGQSLKSRNLALSVRIEGNLNISKQVDKSTKKARKTKAKANRESAIFLKLSTYSSRLKSLVHTQKGPFRLSVPKPHSKADRTSSSSRLCPEDTRRYIIKPKKKAASKMSKEQAKMLRFIKQTQMSTRRAIARREKQSKQKAYHVPGNKSKLTKLFETSAAQQLRSFRVESLIKPNFMKNMLPRNLDTQIFKQIYQKYFHEQEEIERSHIERVMGIKAASKRVNALKKCCSAEDYSHLEEVSAIDERFRRRSIGSSQMEYECSKLQVECGAKKWTRQSCLSVNGKECISQSTDPDKPDQAPISPNPATITKSKISKNPFTIRIRTLRTQSSASQLITKKQRELTQKKTKKARSKTPTDAGQRLPGIRGRSGASRRNSKKLSIISNGSHKPRNKKANAGKLKGCLVCKKHKNHVKAEQRDAPVTPRRRKAQAADSILLHGKTNFIRQDSGHKFINEVDYVVSDDEQHAKKLADKTNFWLFKVNDKADPLKDQKNYRAMNLKEKNQFFHNLSKKDFFSKILKFKKQRAKTVEKFGKEFEKLENEQSRSNPQKRSTP